MVLLMLRYGPVAVHRGDGDCLVLDVPMLLSFCGIDLLINLFLSMNDMTRLDWKRRRQFLPTQNGRHCPILSSGHGSWRRYEMVKVASSGVENHTAGNEISEKSSE